MTDSKEAARAAALVARAAAHAAGVGAARMAAGNALSALRGLPRGAVAAGYLAIRDEIDARPAMLALVGLGLRVAVPVIRAADAPLTFREWSPGCALEPGPFGVPVPVEGRAVEPDALLVPMLAFDRRCHRLGYGGGFYDRTIAALRARGRVVAVGIAYAGQEVTTIADGAHDVALDAIATENELVRPG